MSNNNFSHNDMGAAMSLVWGQGTDLNFVELGVFDGRSSTGILQSIGNRIKTFHAVDPWLPYVDEISTMGRGDEDNVFEMNEFDMELHEIIARHVYTQFDNVEIHKETALEFLSKQEDESLDVVFHDSHITIEQQSEEFDAILPKLKTGGLYVVHDVDIDEVADVCVEKEGQLGKEGFFWQDCWMYIK